MLSEHNNLVHSSLMGGFIVFNKETSILNVLISILELIKSVLEYSVKFYVANMAKTILFQRSL